MRVKTLRGVHHARAVAVDVEAAFSLLFALRGGAPASLDFALSVGQSDARICRLSGVNVGDGWVFGVVCGRHSTIVGPR